MNCPNCGNKQKVKDGMTCGSCKYKFALNPKEEPKVSDKAFRMAMDKLSGMGNNYFTGNQLYAQIYRMIRKKKGKSRKIGMVFVGILILAIPSCVAFTTSGFEDLGSWMVVLGAFLFAAILMLIWSKRPLPVKREDVLASIKRYLSVHPTDRLVTGKMMQNAQAGHFDEEFFKYAPERILIVPRNDMAEMLIFNGFHTEQRTLVVSIHKYPEQAYQAFLKFLDQHPDIPIHVIHDASKKGLEMTEYLLKHKDWGLEGKNVKDLGLFPEDVKGLDEPIWVSTGTRADKTDAIPAKASPQEKVNQGAGMPVDVAPPRAFIGAVGLAMITGAALLSASLLAEQAAASTSGDSGLSGGYG
jgi:hypothetical protein